MNGLAIERDREAIILCFQAKRMPFTRSDLDVGGGKLLATAFYNTIEADIVFQRIRTNHVIIVRRSDAQRDAAGLINSAGDGLEANRDLHILRRHWLINCERETKVCSIGVRLFYRAFAWGRGILDDRPLTDRALAGSGKFKIGRRTADRHFLDRDHDGSCLSRRLRGSAYENACRKADLDDGTEGCK